MEHSRAMLTLRPYQRKAVDDIFRYFETDDGDPVAILPTAAGKSVILATFMREACEQYAGTRIIVLTHVAKLLKQNMQKLLTVWPEAPADFYSASLGKKNHRAQIIFAGIQSVWKKAYQIQECDVILIDECHLVSPKETTRYRKFLADIRLINPHVKIVGFTATPWRLDSGMLYGQEDSLFTDCCHETTIPELLEAGYLCPITTRRTATELDTSGVGSRGGEFIASQLQAATDKEEVTRACIDEVVKLNLTPGLLFATGVEHAYHIRDEIRSRGFSCEVIDGGTDEKVRDRFISDMLNGRLDYLSNCGTLTTGVDIPPLRMIGDLAPTKSPALHVQKLGRLMRLSPGKTQGIVLDFARNVDEHGPIDLINPKPKGKAGTGDAPVKTCPECQSKMFIGQMECYDCGYEFPEPEVKISADPSDGAIISSQIEADWVNVTDVSYSLHKKAGKPDSMKVTYLCGLVSFNEWICFNHQGIPQQKAMKWWRERMHPDIVAEMSPGFWVSTQTALQYANYLDKPEAIRVRKVGKYPEIMEARF